MGLLLLPINNFPSSGVSEQIHSFTGPTSKVRGTSVENNIAKMVRVSGCQIAIGALLVVTLLIAVTQAGIVTNQSVSSSSSVSSDSKPKSPRVGKVLYTAPYSHVRVTKHESLIPQGKPRSFGPGPVLVKSKKMEEEPVQPPPSVPISSTETTDPDTGTTTLTTEPSN